VTSERGDTVHVPVLLEKVLYYLAPISGRVYIDATVGPGGHAEAILEASAPNGRLLGLDRDPEALELARARLLRFGDRVCLEQASFADLDVIACRRGFCPADGVLFDLGVSSLQLASGQRGFSFRGGGYLDMRFGPEGPTAAELLRRLSERELETLLRQFGEEPKARAIARAVVQARRTAPIETSEQLSQLVERVYGGRRGRVHPATRTFQALRIAVNRELEVLDRGLDAAIKVLKPGGRLVVISFHSLEDRIVKAKFRFWASGAEPKVKVLTKKPVRPSEVEVRNNPRARSARLRVAEVL
jgi:16S rRNA (cytosine1402-N4)-methyltransferase